MFQNDEKIKDIVSKSRSQPRRRLQHIYDLAKTKSVCEGGDNVEKKVYSELEAIEENVKVVGEVVCSEITYLYKLSSKCTM